MPDCILEARDLHYRYPCGKVALSGLNLRVTAGRKLAVLGANGSGKTTLFLCLNGTYKPTTGTVLLNGKPTGYTRTDLLAWRKQVGLVFQDPDDQIVGGTVIQDIAFGPLNLGHSHEEARRIAMETMDRIGIADFAERPAHELSHGERKIIAMAGILAMKPKLVILDEPTAGLDPSWTERIIELLNAIHQNGTTVVLSTHNMDFAYEWADEAVILARGATLCLGPVGEVLARDEEMRSARLYPPLLLQTARYLGLAGDGAPVRSRRQLLDRLSKSKIKNTES
ncbi:MAG: ABC transporter ATP-binding protein [bacterium]